MKKLNSAIDFSTGRLLLSVLDDAGNMVFESEIEIKGRDSSVMVPWVKGEFDRNSCSFSDVANWTCGMGPGSFTGLRIVAAMVSGLTFNTSAKVRGVPSAIAIAAEVQDRATAAEYIGVLYDGRRGEALCYGIRSSDGGFSVPETPEFPVITSKDHSNLNEFDLLVAMNTEKTALEKILPESVLDKIIFLDSFPVRRLVDIDNFPWDAKSLLNPVYLRPPVHVKPSTIRKNV